MLERSLPIFATQLAKNDAVVDEVEVYVAEEEDLRVLHRLLTSRVDCTKRPNDTIYVYPNLRSNMQDEHEHAACKEGGTSPCRAE